VLGTCCIQEYLRRISSFKYLVVGVALDLVSVDTVGALLIAINVFGPVTNEKLGVEEKSFGTALIWPSVAMRAL
jgi:hypothetical protein